VVSTSRLAVPNVTSSERTRSPMEAEAVSVWGPAASPLAGASVRTSVTEAILRRVRFVTEWTLSVPIRAPGHADTPDTATHEQSERSARSSTSGSSSSELCELHFFVESGSASGPSQHLTLSRVQPPGCHRVYPLIHSPHMAHGHPEPCSRFFPD
jgi:hypothetical protein